MLVVPIVTAKQIEGLRPEKPDRLPVVGWVVTCAAGFFLAAAIGMSSVVAADDWPQINGPNRNGIAVDETLQKEWPNKGLIEIWTHPVGQGFAGPVVVGETLIIFHRPGKKYLVEALNSRTGRLIWNKELAADDMSPGDEAGPKSAPLIHGDHVYLLGVGGNLYCLKLADGEVVWGKNVLREYRSPPGFFGAGSTPIVVAEKLLLNVGGQNAAVVAFDLKTGQEEWKAFDDRASYSSPIEASIQGQSVAVFITRLNLLGLNPETGKV